MADKAKSGVAKRQPKTSPAQQATVTLPDGESLTVSSASPGMATDSRGSQIRITPQLAKSALAASTKGKPAPEFINSTAAAQEPDKQEEDRALKLLPSLDAAADKQPALAPAPALESDAPMAPPMELITPADLAKSVGKIFKMQDKDTPASCYILSR